jgi:predicted branched-subunit amino acid permease
MSVPLGVASIAFGLGFGVLARETGLSFLEAVVMSGTVFAGASQMVAMEAWSDPPAILALTILVTTINIRHVVMGAALRPWMQAIPVLKSHATLAVMTDVNWAMGMAERRKGEADAGIILGGGLILWVGWVCGTALGHTLGEAMGDPRAYGIDVIVPAFFALMLSPLWPGWRNTAPWFCAAVVALLVHSFVGGTWHVVAGGLAGAALGGWLEGRAASKGPSATKGPSAAKGRADE